MPADWCDPECLGAQEAAAFARRLTSALQLQDELRVPAPIAGEIETVIAWVMGHSRAARRLKAGNSGLHSYCSLSADLLSSRSPPPRTSRLIEVSLSSSGSARRKRSPSDGDSQGGQGNRDHIGIAAGVTDR
jgi:hypothetical protein